MHRYHSMFVFLHVPQNVLVRVLTKIPTSKQNGVITMATEHDGALRPLHLSPLPAPIHLISIGN